MDIIKHPMASIAALSDGKHSTAAFEKLGLESEVRPIPLYELNKDGTPRDWAAEPKHLRADVTSERLMLVFDIFLIAIPAVLIIKIILCLIAYGIDKWKRNISIETVSPLSVFLVKFNEQVRQIDRGSRYPNM
jgi:hypothetical protein